MTNHTAGTRAGLGDGQRPLRVGDDELPAGVVPLLTIAGAAAYLGLSVRHLQDRADVPRIDVSAPGATKPQWRYRLTDLEAFAASRLVSPRPQDRKAEKSVTPTSALGRAGAR